TCTYIEDMITVHKYVYHELVREEFESEISANCEGMHPDVYIVIENDVFRTSLQGKYSNIYKYETVFRLADIDLNATRGVYTEQGEGFTKVTMRLRKGRESKSNTRILEVSSDPDKEDDIDVRRDVAPSSSEYIRIYDPEI